MADESLPEGLDQFIAAPSEAPRQAASLASDEPKGLDSFIEPELKEEKFGSLGQQAIAGIEGIAGGVLGPIAPAVERGLGVKPEDIRARAEVNPITHTVGELTGLGGSMVAGVGLGSSMVKAGEAAAGVANLGKVGSAAVRGVIENAVFQGSDELSKLVLGDPNQSAETAVVDMGLAAMLGGGIGAGGAAASSLWNLAKGSETAQTLKIIVNKLGGIEGAVPDAIDSAIEKTGINIPPEVKAGLSGDPYIQQMFKTLEQSDTTGSGRKLQESYKNFKQQAGDAIISALGREPSEVDTLANLSKYEAGKAIGKTLAKEYEAQISPVVKQFDELKTKFKNAELVPDMQVPGTPAIPGTTSTAIDKISKLAVDEGWASSPSSDIMKEVNRVIKELPLQKTVKNLSDYISQVGNNMQNDPFNGPLRRAGGMIKGILKDAEADAIEQHMLMKKEAGGREAVNAFRDARAGYKLQSDLQEALNSRLHTKSSTSGFASALKEMAETDGESVLRRLSGNGDADLLKFVQEKYPETAKLIKDYHISELIKTGVDRAKPGMNLNSEALLKNLNKMSPELRNFIAPPEAQVKANAVGQLLDEFNKLPHNYSNTARTLDKLVQYIPGSAVAAATALAGGGPLGAALAGYLTKVVGKDIPDAMRLGLLKLLGSSQRVEAESFKSMVDTFNHAIEGEKLTNKVVNAVFSKKSPEALPASKLPSEKDRSMLDKAAKMLITNPNSVMNLGRKAAYYIPDHDAAMTQSAVVSAQFLNQARPNAEKQAPLDSNFPITPAQKADFDNVLNIAQQPLVVLDKIKKGTLTLNDVHAINQMYPALYKRLSQKLASQMAAAVSKGEIIPYRTRMSLSLFLGQPLDSTLTPAAIQAAAQPSRDPSMEMPQMQGGKTRGAPGRLQNSKLPMSYMTPDQKSQSNKLFK